MTSHSTQKEEREDEAALKRLRYVEGVSVGRRITQRLWIIAEDADFWVAVKEQLWIHGRDDMRDGRRYGLRGSDIGRCVFDMLRAAFLLRTTRNDPLSIGIPLRYFSAAVYSSRSPDGCQRYESSSWGAIYRRSVVEV